MKILVLILIVTTIFCSCSSAKRMSSEQYLSWFSSDENPINLVDTSNSYALHLRHVTREFDAALCLRNDCLPKDTIKRLLKTPTESLAFQLKFKLPHSDMFSFNPQSSIPDYERMQYYGFNFKEDIHLITLSNDTLDCASLIFERGLPKSPTGNFEISFPFHELSKIRSIEIKNRALSKNAAIFNFTELDTELPQLKL